MKDCDICGGSRTVRLHVRQPLMAYALSEQSLTATDLKMSSREYPGPECSEEKVSLHRLQAVSTMREAPREVPISYVKDSVAAALLHELRPFITFKKGPVDEFSRTYEVRGTIAVATSSNALEAQVAARQTDIAESASAIAEAEINAWGSALGWTTISKADAVRFVRESIRRAVKAREMAA
jgi:hypothetical protein